MDLNATIDIIIKDLREACDIINDLKKYQGVPVLQIELARAKCRSAAEVIALLKELHGKTSDVAENKPEKKESGFAETEEHFVNDLAVEKEIKSEPAEKKAELIESKVKPTEIHIIDAPEERKPEANPIHLTGVHSEAGVQSRQTVRKQSENAIIADQFSNLGECFNEKIGNLKQEDDISQILQTKPLANLSEAIGINDKFLFIREIFSGDAQVYNEAILKLNSALSFDDARALVSAYTRDDTDADAVKQLMDLLKRKFRTNE